MNDIIFPVYQINKLDHEFCEYIVYINKNRALCIHVLYSEGEPFFNLINFKFIELTDEEAELKMKNNPDSYEQTLGAKEKFKSLIKMFQAGLLGFTDENVIKALGEIK